MADTKVHSLYEENKKNKHESSFFLELYLTLEGNFERESCYRDPLIFGLLDPDPVLFHRIRIWILPVTTDI